MFHVAVLAVVASQTISVSPASVRFDHVQTVKGKDWPVIEFCSRTVRLRLESPQSEFKIGNKSDFPAGMLAFRTIGDPPNAPARNQTSPCPFWAYSAVASNSGFFAAGMLTAHLHHSALH